MLRNESRGAGLQRRRHGPKQQRSVARRAPLARRSSAKTAAKVLRAGGIVAYPTEAVYGLGCDPRNEASVSRLLRLKRRSRNRGLILIAADFQQLKGFLRPLSHGLRQQVLPTWPGPVTWALPARFSVPGWLRGCHRSLAVRVTDHPLASALCREARTPIVSTSANLSGQTPARTAGQVRQLFRAGLDVVLEGPVGGHLSPTEIRDALTGRTIRSATRAER